MFTQGVNCEYLQSKTSFGASGEAQGVERGLCCSLCSNPPQLLGLLCLSRGELGFPGPSPAAATVAMRAHKAQSGCKMFPPRAEDWAQDWAQDGFGSGEDKGGLPGICGDPAGSGLALCSPQPMKSHFSGLSWDLWGPCRT